MASIAPSGGFSIETLIRVWLCHKRLSQIGVFLLWKMEYPNDYITAMKHVASKMAAMEGRLYWISCWQEVYHRDVFSGQVDLAYDTFLALLTKKGITW